MVLTLGVFNCGICSGINIEMGDLVLVELTAYSIVVVNRPWVGPQRKIESDRRTAKAILDAAEGMQGTWSPQWTW